MVNGIEVEDNSPLIPKHRFLGFSKRCSLIAVILAAVFAILFIAFVALYTRVRAELSVEEDKSKVTCVTSDCLQSAAGMMKVMDTSIEPCDDFYAYACGNWEVRHTRATQAEELTVLQKINDVTYKKVVSILNDRTKNFEPNSVEWKLKRLFRVCYTHYSRNDSVKTFVTHMTTVLNGSYLFEPDGVPSTWNFQNALENAHINFKSNFLFNIDVVPTGVERTTITQLQFEPILLNALWYQKESKYGDQALNTYTSYMQKVLESSSVDIGLTLTPKLRTKINTYIADVLQVEKIFAAASSRSMRRLPTSTTLGSITKMFDNTIDFVKYYQTVFGENVNFNSETTVEILTKEEFTSFSSSLITLQKRNTFQRMMNNYISWRVLNAHIQSFPSKYANFSTPVLKIIGKYKFPGFWQICYNKMTTSMDKGVLYVFVKYFLAPTTGNTVNKMIAYIKKGQLSLVDRLWKEDEDTKQKIQKKISSLKYGVGYSSWIQDTTAVYQYYQELNITEDSIENEINVNKFLLAKKAELIKNGMELGNWANVFNLNIRLYWDAILLDVPAAILHLPLYGKRETFFKNLGALGHYIASEMFYLLYDDVPEWKPDAANLFLKKEQCFDDQSKNIKVGPYLVDGVNKTVVISNPQPNGFFLHKHFFAQQIVLETYKAWLQDYKDKMLPGFPNSTPEGMLLLSTSQAYCESLSLQAAQSHIHAGILPDKWIVNTALANSPQFAKAYSCKKGSQMVAEKTCYQL